MLLFRETRHIGCWIQLFCFRAFPWTSPQETLKTPLADTATTPILLVRRQELDSSLEEASVLRERFREAESRFNNVVKDAAGVAETTREELTAVSEQQKSAFAKREEELKRRVEGLQEV